MSVHLELENVIVMDTERKGRGVFARRPLSKGELIVTSPVIVIPPDQVKLIDGTVLWNYYHLWGEEGIAVGLSVGTLCNHSYQPNAVYLKRFAERLVDFVALRDIAEGEEVTVNYNGDPEDKKPIWFDPVE